MSQGSERFHEILKELGSLHDQKQLDYGSDTDPFANVRATEGWNIPGWVGASIRLGDKVQRLKSMWRNGYLANEAVEDSLRDIAVYAIIALVLYEETNLPTQEEQTRFDLDENIRRLEMSVGNFEFFFRDVV